MPVRVPAFLMRSWSVLPAVFVFLGLFGRQNGGAQPPGTSRRGCKKLKLSFLHPHVFIPFCLVTSQARRYAARQTI